MEQSLRIIEQAVSLIPAGPTALDPGWSEGPEIEPAAAIAGSRGRKRRERIRLSPNLEGSEKTLYPAILAGAAGPVIPPKEDVYTTIEGLISHFKFFMKGHGIQPPKGEAYFSVEGGNGELGFYVVSDGTDKPYRLHLRAPCFHIVAALEDLIRGRFLADVIPTFGSLNMIGGEMDR